MKDEITREERVTNLKGLGSSRKRVEDARFTQGKGHYVDDINLPGMLTGDFVRSPYAHARVKSINIDAAMALDGVVAVLTAKDLEPLSLHWMPTLAGDKQMVLADGDAHKQKLIKALVEEEKAEKVFVFCKTRAQCTAVGQHLAATELKVGYLHGEIPQSDRKQVLNRVRDGK